MKIEDETDIYEITPCQLIAGGMPILNPTLNRIDANEIEMSGFVTLVTTVEEAQRRSEGLLKVVYQQLKKGDHQPLVNLLDEHPQFIGIPRIRIALTKWIGTKRSYRKPGRPRKGSLRHPLVIAGIVDSLMSGSSSMSKGDAFECVADWLCISASTARDNYYNARSQERFKPLLMQYDPEITTPIEANFGRVIEAAELLECGKKVRRTLANTAGSNIVATFSAKKHAITP